MAKALVFLAMAVVAAVLTWLQPMVRDDYWYTGQVARTADAAKFSHGEMKAESVVQPQGFAAGAYEWRYVTGRYSCGVLAGTMGRWPRGVQAAMNGCVWAALLALILLLGGVKDCWTCWGIAGLSVIALLHFETALWMCGKYNYLWSAVAVLGYWLLAHHSLADHERRHLAWDMSILGLGFLVGGFHEVMVVPFAGVLALEMVWRRRFCWPLLGLFAGVALNVLSPANWARAEHFGAFAAADVCWLAVRKLMALLRAALASPWAVVALLPFVYRKGLFSVMRLLLYCFAVVFTVAISDCAGRAGWGIMVYGLLFFVGVFPKWRRGWCLAALGVALAVVTTTGFVTVRKNRALTSALGDWLANPHDVMVMAAPREDVLTRIWDRSFHDALGPGKGEVWQNPVLAAACDKRELIWLTPEEWRAVQDGDKDALRTVGLCELPADFLGLAEPYGFFDRVMDRLLLRGMARGSRLPEREVLRTGRSHEEFGVSTPRGRQKFAWVGHW
ncbi:MAG: DUF6056 family protein [Kiritimatiellae bacterium]|nr:DUF6056 family protein [Kiritimatiellia bacterium]